MEEGKKAVSEKDAKAIQSLLRDYLEWNPIIPTKKNRKIDLKGFAEMLAPLCRMLRDDVVEALKDEQSPLNLLAKDWRQLLFPDASDDQFADAYAQTVTFALLLARSEGAEPLSLTNAENKLSAEHSLLSRALQVLTDPAAQEEISASLNLLIRIISEVPPLSLIGPEDPWLYFYEDFLAVYDPKLRKNAGAYYTPIEVVRAQVRLIDDLLTNRLGKTLGFADKNVVTLDPALGTGTYLLGVINHALDKVEKKQGSGAVPGKASELAKNLYGFERMVGPFAVAELRVSRVLQDKGAVLPEDGTHVYLTDTLESPNVETPQLPLFLRPIAEQHAKALQIKSDVPVIVCLGNPPYDRHEASTGNNKTNTGGWVRWGDTKKGTDAIFRDFLDSAIAAGYGIHVKWLYNLYVYFWRWVLWKVFEHETSQGPGVVSFITAASYLFSDAFVGMREHMRRQCDEIWILDLGGEGRGGRKDDNVFAIQTPVAIAVAVRIKKKMQDKPAKVHYARIEGDRNSKLRSLDAIEDFKTVKWQDCSDDWQAPFLPVGEGEYFKWPIIRDLFPWQHSGSQLFRNWPIAPDTETLKLRWRALLKAPNRSEAFKESRDRQVGKSCKPLLASQRRLKPIASLPVNEPCPEIAHYAFRSFDRQYVIVDSRVGDVMKPVLWQVCGDQRHSTQVYITSQLWQVIGYGPALSVSNYVPDFHHFKGSFGGKDVIPLYRDAEASEANILPGLLELISSSYKKLKQVTPEDFLAYVYGVLAQPAFTSRFQKELESRELRVPITKDASLFMKVRDIGSRLMWLHTYGERFVPKGKTPGQVPKGKAKCVKAVLSDPDNYPEKFEYELANETLYVGEGEFRPVSYEVFEFEVSGLKVVKSWLGYRMKKGAGKKSSPLDDIRPERWTSQFTTELLELLWVLEATLKEYPKQAELLEEVVNGPCFKADELPEVPEEARKPPKADKGRTLLDEMDTE
ncbi:MAG: type ISP restriction/modification enzyme [bacterium]